MSLANAVFSVAGLAAVLLGACVVIERRVIYATFGLVGVMIAQSLMFAALGSAFLAVLQITLYAGAIMVLFLFVIMLLGPARLESPRGWVRIAGAGLLALAAGVGVARLGIWAEGVDRPGLAPGLAEVRAVGTEFLGRHLASFEMASLLLVVAMIGVMHFMRKSAP